MDREKIYPPVPWGGKAHDISQKRRLWEKIRWLKMQGFVTCVPSVINSLYDELMTCRIR
jgi:hypothetical protein